MRKQTFCKMLRTMLLSITACAILISCASHPVLTPCPEKPKVTREMMKPARNAWLLAKPSSKIAQPMPQSSDYSNKSPSKTTSE